MTSPNADPIALRARVESVPFWWHRIDLGAGVVTPGHDDSPGKLRRLGLPERLGGRSVIDVGAWDGFFSFECERRGASRVLAVDRWDTATAGETPAGFDVAREALGSRVERLRADVMELTSEMVGRFDLVLFLGVLYHLEDPLGALRRLRSITAGTLVIETETDLWPMRRPALAFYPGRELADDPTNWFAPNEPGLHAMLRAAGFASARTVWRTPVWSRPARAWRHRASFGTPLRAGLRRGRIVVHAE